MSGSALGASALNQRCLRRTRSLVKIPVTLQLTLLAPLLGGGEVRRVLNPHLVGLEFIFAVYGAGGGGRMLCKIVVFPTVPHLKEPPCSETMAVVKNTTGKCSPSAAVAGEKLRET